MTDTRCAKNTRNFRAFGRDGCLLISVTGSKSSNYNMGAESDYFLTDFTLETTEDADGHDHYQNAKGDTVSSNLHQRTRIRVAVFGKESFSYE